MDAAVRQKLTAAQIADSLEISIRTVYRYIDALGASGVPVVAESGHDGGVHILESFSETPLFFNALELKALVDAYKFAVGAGYPYARELESALKKVENGLHEEQRHDLSLLTSGLDVIAPSRPPSVVPLLRELELAVKAGQTIHLTYRKENAAQDEEREVDPYGLAYDRSEWYMVGFCHRAQAIRTYRVDRIVNLALTDACFPKPAPFSVSAYFRSQLEPEHEENALLVVIRIEGEPDTLNKLCSNWHLRHYLTERTDREARFLLDVPSMNKYLPKYLLSFGTSIRILEPVELKEQIQELACAISRHYMNDAD